MKYDIILRNARIFDGGGSSAFEADLAIKAGRIARISLSSDTSATREIDLAGLTVAPGFIDSHSHADLALLSSAGEYEKIRMGVTTEVIGQCGFTAHPVSDAHRELRCKSMAGFLPGEQPPWEWSNLEQYKAAVTRTGVMNNIVPLVGHGSVRMAVMGNRSSQPDAGELAQMQSLVREAMDMGAFGLSSGLIYAPACYAATKEVKALCEVVAEFGGLYVTHMRGETAPLIDAAIEEAMDISVSCGLPLQISHLKVIGRRAENQGKIGKVLEKIETARERGLDINFDCYPYTEGSTLLSTLIPRWAQEQGVDGLIANLNDPISRARIRQTIETDIAGWENWIQACGWDAIKIASVDGGRTTPIVGQSLRRIADERGSDPYEVLFDILVQERANVIMVFSMMREVDMLTALAHPLGMIGTDAIPCPPGQGRPHPRGYGTFPRVLGRYARDQAVFNLEEAVRKMTSLPAKKLGLRDRGWIAEGMGADLVVFDAEKLIDRATYQHPRQKPAGFVHILVNGRLAMESGRLTGVKAGEFLSPSHSSGQ
jgi:N-acyl-D-amino-acid deacylase